MLRFAPMKIKTLKQRVKAFERTVIAETIPLFKNRTQAAAALGITTQTLRLKAKK